MYKNIYSISWFVNCIPQASENLGMAMVYTLVSTAKEWLSERYGQDASTEDADAEEAAKDDVWMFSNISSFL